MIWTESAQEQGIGDDRDGTQCHGKTRKLRTKDDSKTDEDACGNRYTNDIVEQREE